MVSGTTDRFLTKDAALRSLYPVMEPNLFWLGMFPTIPEDSPAFLYLKEANTSSDSKKKTPAPHLTGSQFPEIDFSNPTAVPEATKAKGFAVRIPADLLRGNPTAISNQYRRCYEKAGFLLAEAINTNILSTLTSGATTPTWTPVDTWDSTAARPIKDTILLAEQMEREGYPFKLTDCYINKTNWYELLERITAIDSSGNSMAIFSATGVNGDVITMPYTGVRYRKNTGIGEGYCLGLDTNYPAAEIHYYTNPEFSQQQIRYQTIENNQKTWKTADNFGIGFYTYTEDDTHDRIMQFQFDLAPVVTQSYGLLYDNGI